LPGTKGREMGSLRQEDRRWMKQQGRQREAWGAGSGKRRDALGNELLAEKSA